MTAAIAAFVPPSVRGAGRAHEAFAGKPEQVNVTVCVEPFTGVTVRLIVPGCSAFTVKAVLAGDSVKSAAVPFTVCVIAAEVLGAKFVLPPY